MPLLPFFDPRRADADGLVALTDELTWQMLAVAYSRGIFPWRTDPVAWFCPAQRAIFAPGGPRLPSNLPRLFRRSGLHLSCDTAFSQVMQACADTHLAAGRGAWIDAAMVAAYSDLWARGLAHSVEVWAEQELVGGVYGVMMGGMFAAESMFQRRPNASKFALAALGDQLRALGVSLWDVQVLNPFTQSLGAFELPRATFLQQLAAAVARRWETARWAQRPAQCWASPPLCGQQQLSAAAAPRAPR